MTRAKELQQFWQILDLLVGRGMPLLDAIGVARSNGISYQFGVILDWIYKDLTRTPPWTFAKALSRKLPTRRPCWFSPAEIELIERHEKNGTLESALSTLGTHQLYMRSDQFIKFWERLKDALETDGVSTETIAKPLESALKAFDAEFKEKMTIMVEIIEQGKTLAEAMEASKVFTLLEQTIIERSERTGELDWAIQTIIDLSR